MTVDDEINYAEQAWSSFKDCDYGACLEKLSKIWSYHYSSYSEGYQPENDNFKKIIKTGNFLLGFNHPIIFKGYEQSFSESISRKWFGGDLYMASATFELSKWFAKEEPLAIILGRKFSTQLDIECILENLNSLGGNPIESLEYIELWQAPSLLDS